MESNGNPLIIGAGPAGLTAALKLVERGAAPRIFEATSHVGGLARTPTDGEWRVDPGGHRFFTQSEEILDLWKSLLPADEWISVPRRSAMLVDGHFVRYPLLGRDLLTQMGIGKGMRGAGSLLWSRLWHDVPTPGTASFREWGTHEFGRHWYTKFFDGYVRKTWLADPAEIASDWANQRIKPIAWRKPRADDPAEQDVFRYPRFGPGQLWEAAAARLAESGTIPNLDSQVCAVRYDGRGWTLELHDGQTVSGDAVFSSMPLRLLVETLDPPPPRHIRAVAAALRHRAVITVAVALRQQYDMPYNWVYTPGKEFRVGRIQNYGYWSRALAPHDWTGSYLGLEYFTLPDEDTWVASDAGLGAIVEQDLRALGFDDPVIDHLMIVRSRFAYPVYDPTRERNVSRIRDYLRKSHPSLHPIGRNGMHRYDNQDHAMLSAIHSVDRYFGGEADPWRVNTERGHHETGVRK
ncbi:NAD(P)/FAD-dependent oxidoreductase [Mycolicibacterium lacusdiani]|uniref:NAD(P)/FAD-dependent oxidoreductase n=1 Tax=Mycolicibacterium lacusdiani TaxID=2895283 RepID=UPI001F3E640D|nr:NAD(P)/FAD-dependent oxidoreductase [Mycolicibacterium lacusdiani]